MYYEKRRSGFIKRSGLGLTHIYYGNGVGKTTRAIGLAIRAAGVGYNVVFVQFMKSGNSGEAIAFAGIPNIQYFCPGRHRFILSKGPELAHYQHALKGLRYTLEAVNKKVQLVICDEILNTLLFGLLKKKQIMDLIAQCTGRIELVMTGRTAPKELLDMADYASEMRQVKHPYYQGTKARLGIEF